MSFEFEPGAAYWFNSCMPGGGKFLAVAAERNDGEVTFVRPADLLTGDLRIIDGRETVVVKAKNGLDYFSSSAARESVAAAGRVLNDIDRSRAGEVVR